MENPLTDERRVPSPLVTERISGLRYFEDFIDEPQEIELLREIDERGRNAWKQLAHRRLQNYGGLPHAKGMVPSPLPRHLGILAAQLVRAGIVDSDSAPNHALVNRYEPMEGIDAHEDGPVFLPCAAIVSLQSQIVMDFYSKDGRGANEAGSPVASIVLHPRSLLCLEGDAYASFLHGIAAREIDTVVPELINSFYEGASSSVRSQRTSITLRRSAKTLKFRLRL